MGLTRQSAAYFSLLKRNPNFRRLWSALTISFFGDTFYNLAITWFVYQKSASSLQVGFVLIAAYLPRIVIGPYFGVLVDNYSRKRLMQLAAASQALVTMLLTVSLFTHTFHILYADIAAALLAIAETMFSPAQGAIVPQLVEEADLVRANSLFSSSQQVARLFGATLGGTAIAFVGAGTAIGIDALSFILSLWLISRIFHHSVRNAGAKVKQSVTKDFIEGLRWIRTHPAILILLLISMVSNIGLGPSNLLPPMYIQHTLHQGAAALGLFDGAIGLGILLAGIFIGMLSPVRLGRWFMGGLALEGIGIIIVSVAPTLWIALCGNFLLGVGLIMANLPSSTFFQVWIPNELRGRVATVASMVSTFATPITFGVLGGIADAVGARICFAVGALLLMACSAMALGARQLRQFNMHTASPGDTSATSFEL